MALPRAGVLILSGRQEGYITDNYNIIGNSSKIRDEVAMKWCYGWEGGHHSMCTKGSQHEEGQGRGSEHE